MPGHSGLVGQGRDFVPRAIGRLLGGGAVRLAPRPTSAEGGWWVRVRPERK